MLDNYPKRHTGLKIMIAILCVVIVLVGVVRFIAPFMLVKVIANPDHPSVPEELREPLRQFNEGIDEFLERYDITYREAEEIVEELSYRDINNLLEDLSSAPITSGDDLLSRMEPYVDLSVMNYSLAAEDIDKTVNLENFQEWIQDFDADGGWGTSLIYPVLQDSVQRMLREMEKKRGSGQ